MSGSAGCSRGTPHLPLVKPRDDDAGKRELDGEIDCVNDAIARGEAVPVPVRQLLDDSRRQRAEGERKRGVALPSNSDPRKRGCTVEALRSGRPRPASRSLDPSPWSCRPCPE